MVVVRCADFFARAMRQRRRTAVLSLNVFRCPPALRTGHFHETATTQPNGAPQPGANSRIPIAILLGDAWLSCRAGPKAPVAIDLRFRQRIELSEVDAPSYQPPFSKSYRVVSTDIQSYLKAEVNEPEAMDANTRKIERIFDQTVTYQVPLFQRPYVWDRENNWEPRGTTSNPS